MPPAPAHTAGTKLVTTGGSGTSSGVTGDPQARRGGGSRGGSAGACGAAQMSAKFRHF